MADKFDEFSKHLAGKQTRRGVMRFFGASVVTAIAATFFARNASAHELDHGKRIPEHFFNQTQFAPPPNLFNATQ